MQFDVCPQGQRGNFSQEGVTEAQATQARGSELTMHLSLAPRLLEGVFSEMVLEYVCPEMDVTCREKRGEQAICLLY